MQVNEKKKKICETQKKYKKASSGSCCGRCFFGILIVAGIEYGCNIQEKNMGNLQNSYVKLDKVSKIYKMGEVEIRAVDNISFEISKGEFVVVVGPSGAGKTTVLNILGGMDTATKGNVFVDGSNIAKYNSHQLTAYRRDDIGFVFQFYNLVPNLTVKENIQVCQYLTKNPLNMEELLQVLGLTEHQNKFPAQLSGGQQQRCAIARALIKNPSLLLCDEPTGALDSKTSRDILMLLEDINRQYGTTMLIVTHNNSIKNMVHQVIMIKDGQISKNYRNEKRVPAAELEDL